MLFVNACQTAAPSQKASSSSSKHSKKAPEKSKKAIHLSKPVQPDNMKALRKAFAEFDSNDDGFITKEELSGVMKNFGHVICGEELDEMMELVDKDGNGVLDFKEFLEMMDSNTLVENQDMEVKSLFAMFDVDADGFITEKEIGNVMKNLGEKVRKKDIRKMVKEADKNKDGRISFTEFKAMVDSGNFLGGK